MTETTGARKLVKARVRPDIHARLLAYAKRTHRTASSAAEHLIALGLERDAVFAPGTEQAR